MGHEKHEMIIEARVVYELQRGSYEELLQALDRAVAENQELFGENDTVLFASYKNHVVVLSEGGKFSKVEFKNKDGVVTLGKVSPISVSMLSENEVASRGIDRFFDGGSLGDSLREIINLKHEGRITPLQKLSHDLKQLFSGGQVWRSYVDESKERIGNFAWDPEFGSLKIEVHPIFSQQLDQVDESDLEEQREEVLEKLADVERRLHARLLDTKEAFGEYQDATIDVRSDEADEVMTRFESFAADYIDHLTEITNFVSGAVARGREECIACTALVHDEVAKRFKELELGGRFVRKVSAQFTQ